MDRDSVNRKLLAGTCTVAAVCVLAVPSAAFGADFYVDSDTGSGAVCTLGAPCATIAAGITAAGMNDTVHVDDSASTYNEAVSLSGGKSLLADDFVDGPEGLTIVDGGAAGGGLTGSAVSVPDANPAGTVQGFVLRGDENGVFAADDVAITGNTFDDPQESGFGDVMLPNSASGDTVSINGNTFTDSVDGVLDNAITTDDGAGPTITGNNFSGYDFSISIAGNGTTAMIVDNTVTGGEGDHFLASGIFLQDDSSATVVHNTVQAPAGGTRGIYVLENDATPAAHTSATLRRNFVSRFQNGVVIDDTTGPVSLSSDLIVNSTVNGLLMRDTVNGGTAADPGDVTATNVTLANNASDLTMEENDLILDSSIVEDAIGSSGTVTCAITFSRGPAMTPGGTGCANFQTTAAPGFINPGADNFGLAVGSAMVDLGNTANPPMGALDIDGDARALDGNLDGTVRRDIGADECVGDCRVPAQPPGGTPGASGATTPTSTATPPAPVKCKKKKKRGAAAAKRCKKKKRK